VSAVGPEPPALRASDADRDAVIGLLREGSAEGRISHDTFVRRVEQVLVTRYAVDLAGVVSDLPVPRRRMSLPARALSWSSARLAEFQAAWHKPRLPRLVLPRGDRARFTIGRAGDSDMTLPDMTVSWRHAELRRAGSEWVLVDVGSTNGTWANGWRVGSGFAVRPGDWVAFGRMEFRLTDQA
jgi:Domain of unknown function (DUF1707)/Inner membrane component of T3SS, cytoplasmic domain